MRTQAPVNDPVLYFGAFREKNDTEGFRFFYDQNYYLVYDMILSLTKDKDLTKDLLQESFIVLYENRNAVNEWQHIRPFLYTVARRLWISGIRKDTARRKREIDWASWMTDGKNHSEVLDAKADLLKTIIGEIDNLPGMRKKVLKLVYLEGKSTDEIAKELGIGSQTVLNHKSRGIDQLIGRLPKELLYLLVLFFFHQKN